MIKYNLKCKNKHEFESWFSDSKEFEKLKSKKIIECTFCGTKNVQKSIMSPKILSSLKFKEEKPSNKFNEVKSKIKEFQNYIEKNFDYVGENFTYEARSIHYGDKKSKKGIYGKASSKDVKELKEEGIEALQIPWVKDTEN